MWKFEDGIGGGNIGGKLLAIQKKMFFYYIKASMAFLQQLEQIQPQNGTVTPSAIATDPSMTTDKFGEFIGTYQGPTPISQALLSCSTEGECNKYGKDDIFDELTRRGLKPVSRPSKADEFHQDALKPQLVKILLNHNKHQMAKLKLQEKQSRMGLRAHQGAFPSAATNPAMYDSSTGLLKTIYLTQDHHGLNAYDYKGDKYTVNYQPKLNGFGGDAVWVKEKSALGPGGRMRDMTGQPFVLDKRGLPKVQQLNYVRDYGSVHKGKNNKWYILVCPNRKNKKSLSIHPSNCRSTKAGNFTMKWVLFDKEYSMEPVPESAEEKKFFLPDGSIVTGKQLNKLSLEEIWRMMMLLELMEQGPKYAERMRSLGISGVGPFATMSQTVEGATVPGAPKKKRKTSAVSATTRALEEQKYLSAGLDECGKDGRPPFRCFSDTYIPGACVPHEEICFQGKYMDQWDKSDKYGRNPKLDWAAERRKELNRAGALESQEGYDLWKAQSEIASGPFGARGKAGLVVRTQTPSKNLKGAMAPGLGVAGPSPF